MLCNLETPITTQKRNDIISPAVGQKRQNFACGGPETPKFRLRRARNAKSSPAAGQKRQNFAFLKKSSIFSCNMCFEESCTRCEGSLTYILCGYFRLSDHASHLFHQTIKNFQVRQSSKYQPNFLPNNAV